MAGTAASPGYGLAASGSAGLATAPVLPYEPPRPRQYRPRIALVGCGGISEYHLRAYQAMGLEVAMLCDRTLAKAEKRRWEFFPKADVTDDFAAVLRRTDIEVVDLCPHPAERVLLIEAALLAGKHVLSQKPFALDLGVGRQLVNLAARQGRQLAVNQNGRWAPHFAYLAAAVRAGIIGEVASVDCTLQWDHTWTTGTPFEEIRHLVLFDFGIHWFDMITQFLPGQRPASVFASVTRTGFQQMKPGMLAQVVVDFPSAQARLAFNGHVRDGQEDRTVICGAAGTLRSFGPSLSVQQVEVHTAAGCATPRLDGTWFTSGFQGAMAELLCAIEDGREATNSARSNLDSLALCFAAMASADEGRTVVPGTVWAAPA